MPVTSQKAFDQRCEHERIRLLFSARKRDASAAARRNYNRVHDVRCDDVSMAYDFWNMCPKTHVSMSYDFPPRNLLGDASPANSPRSITLSFDDSDSIDDWVHIDTSS